MGVGHYLAYERALLGYPRFYNHWNLQSTTNYLWHTGVGHYLAYQRPFLGYPRFYNDWNLQSTANPQESI